MADPYFDAHDSWIRRSVRWVPLRQHTGVPVNGVNVPALRVDMHDGISAEDTDMTIRFDGEHVTVIVGGASGRQRYTVRGDHWREALAMLAAGPVDR